MQVLADFQDLWYFKNSTETSEKAEGGKGMWISDFPASSSPSPSRLISSLLADVFCKAFTDEIRESCHQTAREILEKIARDVYCGKSPALADDKQLLNEIAGAIFTAQARVGEFALISQEKSVLRSAVEKVAGEITKKIIRKYGKSDETKPLISQEFFCFPGGTSILTADGKIKPIEFVAKGDWLLAWNEISKEFAGAQVQERICGTCPDGYYSINDGMLCVTGTHSLFARKPNGAEGWAVIEHSRIPHRLALETGDYLFSAQRSWVPVFKLEHRPGDIEVFNLELGSPHTFFAGRVLVHNGRKKIV